PRSNLSGWGRFGEPLPRRRLSPTGGSQLRMPAFATLTGFPGGGAGLTAAQLERGKRAAEFIAQSWRGTSPITAIRITGYIDANEGQSDLGQQPPSPCATHCFARSAPRGLDWRRGYGGSWKIAASFLSQRKRVIYGTDQPPHRGA